VLMAVYGDLPKQAQQIVKGGRPREWMWYFAGYRSSAICSGRARCIRYPSAEHCAWVDDEFGVHCRSEAMACRCRTIDRQEM
jgi:hypothetical protein